MKLDFISRVSRRLNVRGLLVASLLLPMHIGCRSEYPPDSTDPGLAPVASGQSPVVAEATPPEEKEPIVYELNANGLIAAALSQEQLEQGWVRLFDGQSLAGWFVVGDADWQVSDGNIRVSGGERSYLCTNFMLADYELSVDFRSDPNTNSGVFLRTKPEPDDVASECLELNIAPPDNPFPTASFVQRQRVEPLALGDFDPTQWHTFRVRLVGEQVSVFLDGKPILELVDKTSSRRGHISLQHNSGPVEFRNILLRPVQIQTLPTDEGWESAWSVSEKQVGQLKVEGGPQGLHLVGGLGQVQSNQDFGDFVLQAQYTLARPDVNSGIFFRCVRDAMLDGYECQINHAIQDGDPLRPVDAGAGAIFRRASARIVIGDGSQRTYLTLLASGPQMMTWVNGVQVAEFVDTRPTDDNPRNGLRTAPGPIALQGHDPQTDVVFHKLQISESRP